ncbi:MAG TPA: CAAX prenyl protease-related protein [Gemmatimonadales bacterium]|nr:CAAX prenyl protease-related protein [Gemmatimonadales bacterium]
MQVAKPAAPTRLWDHFEWTVPFAAFMAFLLIGPRLPVSPAVEGLIRVGSLTAIIWIFSRRVLDFRVTHWFGSVALGVGVFLVWIGPDLLFPAWREHWLLQNSITGTVESSFPEEARADILAVLLRATRAIIIVPIVEELFWRGWLMRWVIDMDFKKVPLGTYSAYAFTATAILFAMEHGAFWDVGLAAGVAYNWWMIRTRRLGDLILAHAVTNACLFAYVLASGKWEYL